MSAVLRKDDTPSCVFRDRSDSLQLMQASIVDTHTFTCVSPRVKMEGIVMVSIQSDTGLIEGIDSSGGPFEYMAPMAVHAIVPPLGSSHAVTQIELTGLRLHPGKDSMRVWCSTDGGCSAGDELERASMQCTEP